MRNQIKPVPDDPAPREGREGAAFPPNPPADEADFDRREGSSVQRERGDSVDPAGPKRSTVAGTLHQGGAVTDPSGTTGPVSRSSDRMSTTTGKLGGDRDMERSARQGEAPDVAALNIPTGDSSFSVPVLMAIFAIGLALLLVILWFAWPRGATIYDEAAQPVPAQEQVTD